MARAQARLDGSTPGAFEEHDPVVEYGLLSTTPHQLTHHTLSLLSDTSECVSGAPSVDSVQADMKRWQLQDEMSRSVNQQMVANASKANSSSVHFDVNLSPVSLSGSDFNSTEALLRRAHRENWASFFSSKEGASLENEGWRGLESGEMKSVNRPEPLGKFNNL